MLALNNVVFFSWYEEGSEVPHFESGPPSNLGPSSNSGLQDPPFHLLNITMCRRFEPSPSIDTTYMAISLFIFFLNPPLLARIFHQYCSNEIFFPIK